MLQTWVQVIPKTYFCIDNRGNCAMQFTNVNEFSTKRSLCLWAQYSKLLFWHSEERASWYILVMKANEVHYFSNLFEYSIYFGHINCPSSGVSQHCIHAIGICHSSSIGSLLAWSEWNILTTLADCQQNWHYKYLLRVYSVETLLMMDSGHVWNM
jgi:hypothetical protein